MSVSQPGYLLFTPFTSVSLNEALFKVFFQIRGEYATLRGSQVSQGYMGTPEKADSAVTKTHIWLKDLNPQQLNSLQQSKDTIK